MRKMQKVLKILIFVELGACLLRVLALYNDFTRHRELYATYSAPWYKDIIITAAITVIMVAITATAYFIIRGRVKKRCGYERK